MRNASQYDVDALRIHKADPATIHPSPEATIYSSFTVISRQKAVDTFCTEQRRFLYKLKSIRICRRLAVRII